MMESEAVAGFGALAQETRLRILRLLVQAGPQGRAAGDIALALEVSPSNMSFHLKELERAGLLSQRREARSIIYSANYATISDLIRFLMQDCCNGHPEVCAPALADPCCAPVPKNVSKKAKEKTKEKVRG